MSSHPKHESVAAADVSPIGAHRARVPGPLIRRALSVTVRNEADRVSLSRRRQVSSSQRSDLKQRRIYGQPLYRKASKQSTRHKSGADQLVEGASKAKAGRGSMSKERGKLMLPPEPTVEHRRSSPLRGEEEQPPKDFSPIRLPPLAEAKDSLLLDIPLGTEDRVDRLIRAASLRCYVPSFFHGTPLSQAYAIYTAMPQSLAKSRYEQEACSWSHEWLHGLKSSGVRYIKDLLPISKLKHILHHFEVPELLFDKCIQIVERLNILGVVPLGMTHKDTIQRSAELLDACNNRHTAEGSPSEDLTPVTRFTGTASQEISTHIARNEHRGTEAALSVQGDQSIGAYQMLDQIVSEGPWCGVHAASEDILAHAAFIVCSNDDDGDTESEMGQHAYVKFAEELLRLESDHDRKGLIQRRYRKALALSTPYASHLHHQSCYTVLDMAKTNLSTLNMPSPLQIQLDALISTAVAKSADSRKAFLSYNNINVKRRELAVPLLFDPKFQRSPFDPMGRPPRPASIREIVRYHEVAATMDTSGNDDDLPFGLWDSLHTATRFSDASYSPGSRNRSPKEGMEESRLFGGKAFYQCTFPNCGMKFIRLLNLLKHERTHTLDAYRDFRVNPQVFYDDDEETTMDLLRRSDIARITIPPGIHDEHRISMQAIEEENG